MRKYYLLGIGVALAMAFGWASAQAQLLLMPGGPGVPYFGIEGGWTSLESHKSHIGPISLNRSFNDGFNVGGRVGYRALY